MTVRRGRGQRDEALAQRERDEAIDHRAVALEEDPARADHVILGRHAIRISTRRRTRPPV